VISTVPPSRGGGEDATSHPSGVVSDNVPRMAKMRSAALSRLRAAWKPSQRRLSVRSSSLDTVLEPSSSVRRLAGMLPVKVTASIAR
jgi:hypothetical protein